MIVTHQKKDSTAPNLNKKVICVLVQQNDCISKSDFFLQKNVYNAPKFNEKSV
jgi:hypothetical protein